MKNLKLMATLLAISIILQGCGAMRMKEQHFSYKSITTGDTYAVATTATRLMAKYHPTCLAGERFEGKGKYTTRKPDPKSSIVTTGFQLNSKCIGNSSRAN